MKFSFKSLVDDRLQVDVILSQGNNPLNEEIYPLESSQYSLDSLTVGYTQDEVIEEKKISST